MRAIVWHCLLVLLSPLYIAALLTVYIWIEFNDLSVDFYHIYKICYLFSSIFCKELISLEYVYGELPLVLV